MATVVRERHAVPLVSRAGRVRWPDETRCEHDGRPDERAVAYELVGRKDAPVVVVLGGISAGRHVCAHPGDPRAGWWDAQVGRRDRPIDLARCRVLSFDYVCAEAVTPRDQADALRLVLDSLGIARVAAVVGASYGGAAALAFAADCPERLDAALVIGAAHESHPMATALREIQRRIVRLAVASRRESDGVALARALAFTTYRSEAELRARFAGPPVLRRRPADANGGAYTAEGSAAYPVMAYLERQGRSFAARFSAARYLRLSESLDLHRVDPERVNVPITLVSIDPDAVAPRWQLRELHALLPQSRLIELDSVHGHDAFLTDHDAFGPILTDFLAGTEVAR